MTESTYHPCSSLGRSHLLLRFLLDISSRNTAHLDVQAVMEIGALRCCALPASIQYCRRRKYDIHSSWRLDSSFGEPRTMNLGVALLTPDALVCLQRYEYIIHRNAATPHDRNYSPVSQLRHHDPHGNGRRRTSFDHCRECVPKCHILLRVILTVCTTSLHCVTRLCLITSE